MRCTTQRWIAIGTGMRGPMQRQPQSVGVLCGAGPYHGIAVVYGPSVYRNRLTMAASPWRNIWVYLLRVSDFMFCPNSSSAKSSSVRLHTSGMYQSTIKQMDRGGFEPPTSTLRTWRYTPKPPARDVHYSFEYLI